MEQAQSNTERNWGNCGECLMNKVEVVKLDAEGVCPKCGTDYGATEAKDEDQGAAVERATCEEPYDE